MKTENDLGRDDIRRLVWRIALPSMLAQFVSVLYSVVDRMYIGHIADVGSLALAGVGVCGPVVTMVGAASSWVGIGGTPLMSIRLGEGDTPAARRILSNCFWLLCGLSAVLMAVVLPLREPMLYLFGASGETYAYADAYFFMYMLGTPFALLSVGLNQFIICQGYAKIGMLSVMLGAVANILLDPVFIFGLDMGVRGAALATVLSQVASCAFVLRFLLGRYVPVRLSFGGCRLRTMGKVLVMGLTPFLIIALDNVMIIAMNAVLQHYGGADGDHLITTATIAQSFMLVVTMPLGGISGGTQSILGFNYGARRADRVLQAQKLIALLCVGYTALMTLAAWTVSPLLIRLFTTDAPLQAEAFRAIKICTLAIVPLGVQYAIVDGFTAIGQVQLSLPLSFFRKAVYFAAVFGLPAALGARMVFFAEPVSDILGPLASAVVYLLCIRRILRRRMESGAVGDKDEAQPAGG